MTTGITAEGTGEQERAMRQQQMASFGRLIADFSHEMRNHLAVIQEANGLLEDILVMEGTEGNSVPVLLKETAAQISQRVRRSADLCQHLSGMAHRSDTPCSSFQVNDLVAELVIFLERSTRSRQISLQLDQGQGIDPIYNEPALLQHVLYQLYAFSLELLSNGQTLIISTAIGTVQTKGGVAISFRLGGVPKLDLAELSATVSAAIASLGAKLEGLQQEDLEVTEQGFAGFCGFKLLVPSLPVA
ncbi:His Kinase A (phospho-acceptor) domain [Candidatus Electrothrix aarhusensis]|uniref:His Kinase A (Phospho-acceptor) domain n=1 Tax=Candidatus Electrothrix aarhusensis TaxID=1859131 RepID=A0A444IUL9_9BACT|nr:His Kinase A (phospho-acceptor) domain [Candidatus Electrothrix aarhusensis]